MPTANILKNRERFNKELLDKKHGEQIINGSADGKVQVVPRYRTFLEASKTKKPPEYHMTLIPTNKRIVVYQTSGFARRDRYEQLPLSEIDEILFAKIEERKRLVCITEFIAPNDSRYPSIIFKMDCSGHPDDADQYMVILKAIAQLSGVVIKDHTEGTM